MEGNKIVNSRLDERLSTTEFTELSLVYSDQFIANL